MTKQFILVLIVVELMFYQVTPTQSSTDSSTDNLSNDEYLTDEDQDKEPGVFQPTEEWQEIKKGQSIPAGLHVRINLQTGLKEAKLLDEEEKSNYDKERKEIQVSESSNDLQQTSNYGHSDRRGIINKSTKVFTRQELREMLKKLKDDGPQNIPLLSTTGTRSSEDSLKQHSDTSKSEQSLPTIEDLRQMLTFHADVEIMLKHLQTLTDSETSEDNLVSTLEELEYYVHQIDNARDLDILGGLVVVVRLLNHSNSQVQSAAAHVLGAAVQGNPQVQQQAVAYGALSTLLPLLSVLQPEILQRRSLYALGSLLRGQPSIVETFLLSLNGIEIVSEGAELRTETVLVKIIVLLTDLLSVEGLETEIDLQTDLANNGWCFHTSQLLHSKKSISIEKSLLLMDKLTDVCDYSDQYRLLYKLQRQWIRDGGEENELISIVNDMMKRVRTSRDEL